MWYFECEEQYGVFAPVTRVNKAGMEHEKRTRCGTPRNPLHQQTALVDHGPVDVSGVAAKVDTGAVRLSSNIAVISQLILGLNKSPLQIGDRVLVAGQRKGVVRFVGQTQFSPGVWYGVELDKAVGKNDGAVAGVRYFQCGTNRGVFAPLSRLHKYYL